MLHMEVILKGDKNKMEKILPHDHAHISMKIQHDLADWGAFLNIADVFKMMSDETRVRIFWLLCHCEECVLDISALLDMSSPAVSHHLKLLKNAGLVVSRREGKEVYYTALKSPRTQALHMAIEDMIEVSCPFEHKFENAKNYDSQISVIENVHDFLMENINKRYTIDELAGRFHINQTTLKAEFKKMYAKPIASYMKEMRIKAAMARLEYTNDAISLISMDVGYENQSKFSVAFKDITGMLPKDYRKKVREN